MQPCWGHLSNPDISNAKEVREVISILVSVNMLRYQSDIKLTWHSDFILRGVETKVKCIDLIFCPMLFLLKKLFCQILCLYYRVLPRTCLRW